MDIQKKSNVDIRIELGIQKVGSSIIIQNKASKKWEVDT
jgi:hypothetical protein